MNNESFNLALIDKVSSDPGWFRDENGIADNVKVAMLGDSIAEQELRALKGIEVEPWGKDRRWNAAINCLSQNPLWEEGRKAKLITFQVEEPIVEEGLDNSSIVEAAIRILELEKKVEGLKASLSKANSEAADLQSFLLKSGIPDACFVSDQSSDYLVLRQSERIKVILPANLPTFENYE